MMFSRFTAVPPHNNRFYERAVQQQSPAVEDVPLLVKINGFVNRYPYLPKSVLYSLRYIEYPKFST